MKAVVFTEKGKIQLKKDEPMPMCPADGLLLKTIYSGMTNGTERNQLMGGNYGGRFPIKGGYQLVSEIVQVGVDAVGFEKGEIVYTGTFRGHVEYHAARTRDLIARLPKGYDLEGAALLGVASVPYHDAKRGEIRANDNVLVSGAGLIGLFAVQACKTLGAKVTVTDTNPSRLELARTVGADHTVVAGTPESLANLEKGKPYTAVVEASGAPVLDMIIGTTWDTGLIGRRARVLMIAGRDTVSYNFNAAQWHEVAVMHAGHFEQDDLSEVAEHVGAGRIKVKPLITKSVSIDDAIPVYETLRDHPHMLLGTVFKW